MLCHLCFGIACEIGGGLVTGVAGVVLGVHRQRVLGGRVGKENGGVHQQRDRARTSSEIGRASVRISRTGPYLGVPSWIQGAYGHLYLGPLSRACIEGLHRRLDVGIIGHRGSHLGALFVSP